MMNLKNYLISAQSRRVAVLRPPNSAREPEQPMRQSRSTHPQITAASPKRAPPSLESFGGAARYHGASRCHSRGLMAPEGKKSPNSLGGALIASLLRHPIPSIINQTRSYAAHTPPTTHSVA